MGAARDGAQDVEIGEQGLGGRGVRSHGGARPVVGDAQHEQRIGQDQLARGGRPGDVGLIEPADLPGAQPMRRNRLDEADAVGRVGARHRHEVLHRGVRDQPSGLHVLLDRVGQRAHQTQAPGHPAHAAIEAPRQRVERQAMLLMQRAQQPALLERAGGRVGAAAAAERSAPRAPPSPRPRRPRCRAAGAGDSGRACGRPRPRMAAPVHDHDRHLLAGLGQRGQQPSFPRRLSHAQPLVPQIELMKLELHGSGAGARPGRRRALTGARRAGPAETACAAPHATAHRRCSAAGQSAGARPAPQRRVCQRVWGGGNPNSITRRRAR